MLKAAITADLKTKTITSTSLKKVNVDTTVREKAVTFPTDARLYRRMRGKLAKLAARHGVALRQSCRRVGKAALAECGRLFHNRHTKKAKAGLRKLKTYLRRVRNGIVREIAGNEALKAVFASFLAMADRLLIRKPGDKNKLYSLHEPEVECISRGKALKKYEFGNKAGFSTTSRECFVVGAMGLHGNPHDGHTLTGQLERTAGLLDRKEYLGDVFVDRGYRGHEHGGVARVHICGPGAKRKPGPEEVRLRRWRKRRSAIEPVIGHRKHGGRLGRNWLKGRQGDRTNVILSACGWNVRLILQGALFLFYIFWRVFGDFWTKAKLLTVHGRLVG